MKTVCLLLALGLAMLTGCVVRRGTITPVYAVNFMDDRVLVGVSQNVFIGRVLKKIGSVLPADSGGQRGHPYTRFQVTVIENLKGELEGKIFVDQLGGTKGRVFKTLYTLAGSKPLVAEGVYLFATRARTADKTHFLQGHPRVVVQLIGDAEGLSKEEIIEVAKSHRRVNELETAHRNEISPLD